MSARTVRTTITLPVDLADAADRAVREGKARSRNDLLVAALRHELAAQERAEIDAAFAALADDRAFHAESIAIAEEAVQSGWEALKAAEADG
jgi:metal-responsive CopG/Arc/MetJ family transcriptional regulator